MTLNREQIIAAFDKWMDDSTGARFDIILDEEIAKIAGAGGGQLERHVRRRADDVVAFFNPVAIVIQDMGTAVGVLQEDGVYLMETGAIMNEADLLLRNAVFADWSTLKKHYVIENSKKEFMKNRRDAVIDSGAELSDADQGL